MDNRKAILPLLKFDNNQVYQILILRRRKDFKEGVQKEDVRLIKDYYIDSIEKLDYRYEEMKTIADLFEARVYINLNARDTSKIGLRMLKIVSDAILSDSNRYKSCFRKAFAECQKVGDKYWIIDVDGEDAMDQSVKQSIIDLISQCLPVGDKIVTQYNTKNGYHLITKPFNQNAFWAKTSEQVRIACEVKTSDNPALLYMTIRK